VNKFFFLSLFLIILTKTISLSQAIETKKIELRKIEQEIIKQGEVFEYKIKWGFIPVGYAKMYIKNDTVIINNQEVIVAISEAWTAPYFDPVYKVRDSVQSFIDKEGFFSWKYIIIQREGPFLKDEIINYFYNENKFNREVKKYKKEYKEFREEYPLNELIQDPLSCLYWTRLQQLKKGEKILVRTNSSDAIIDIEVDVKRYETIEVPAGKFNTIVVQPNLKGKETIFKNEGTLMIWFSNDKYKIPVKMEGKIIIGSIKVYLTNYYLP